MIGIMASTILFLTFIIIAQVISPPEYSWKTNTVSEVAAQKYKNRKLMQAGFISFGLFLFGSIIYSIIVDQLLLYKGIPILIYALSVGMSGIFCTRPFVENERYSEKESKLHSLFAQLAGFSFMTEIAICFVVSPYIKFKIIHTIAAVMVMVCSFLFAKFPVYRGFFQRLMYMGSFLWLIFMYSTNL